MMTEEEILLAAADIRLRMMREEHERAARKDRARERRNAMARQKRHAEKMQTYRAAHAAKVRAYIAAHPTPTNTLPQYIRFADDDLISVGANCALKVETSLRSHEWIYMHCLEPSDG